MESESANWADLLPLDRFGWLIGLLITCDQYTGVVSKCLLT